MIAPSKPALSAPSPLRTSSSVAGRGPQIDIGPTEGDSGPTESGSKNSAAPQSQVASTASAEKCGYRPGLRNNLNCSLLDAGMFSVMVGAGETYFPAFALALGLSQVASGLVATVPLLVGSLLQLAAPFLMRRVGSYRTWIVGCVAGQATVFISLIVLALQRRIPAALLFVFVAVYWGTGLATGPAWNTWIGTLVPVGMRAKFFAKRTRMVQAGTLVGFVLAGVALQFGAAHNAVLVTFACLFAAAGLCRYVSAFALSQQAEPTPPGDEDRHVSLREFASRIGKRVDGKFLLYLMAIQAAVQFSGPYFTPYMLKQLKLSYVDYMLLVAAAFAAKMLSLPWLGRVAQNYGAKRLLAWGSLGIIPLSSLWLVSDNYYYALVLQAAGGVAWAGYELAWFLLFFEMLPREERTSVLTTFNFGHSAASVVGSVAGGLLLMTLGEHREIYYALFVGSSLLRIFAYVKLRPRFHDSGIETSLGRVLTSQSIDIAASEPHAPGLTVAPTPGAGQSPSSSLR